MGYLNRVTIIGNLGADVDLKYAPSGKAVANFSVATTETWKDKGGAKQEKTEWHRVTVWDVLAENCAKFLAKGRSVCVEGKLQTRTYEKDGIKRYSTEIIAHNVVFLGSGNGGERGERGGGDEAPRGRREDGGGQQRPPAGPPPGGDDSDIPFIYQE